MNAERDQFLTEAIGFSFHDNNWWYKGEKVLMSSPLNFSAWEIFGILWEYAIKQEWWDDFWDDIFEKAGIEYEEKTRGKVMPQSYFWCQYFVGLFDRNKSIINPDKFANALYKFLKEGK